MPVNVVFGVVRRGLGFLFGEVGTSILEAGEERSRISRRRALRGEEDDIVTPESFMKPIDRV